MGARLNSVAAGKVMSERSYRSTILAALWMTGWLTAMVLLAVAARQAGKSVAISATPYCYPGNLEARQCPHTIGLLSLGEPGCL